MITKRCAVDCRLSAVPQSLSTFQSVSVVHSLHIANLKMYICTSDSQNGQTVQKDVESNISLQPSGPAALLPLLRSDQDYWILKAVLFTLIFMVYCINVELNFDNLIVFPLKLL